LGITKAAYKETSGVVFVQLSLHSALSKKKKEKKKKKKKERKKKISLHAFWTGAGATPLHTSFLTVSFHEFHSC
jgi:hypothetical protein